MSSFVENQSPFYNIHNQVESLELSAEKKYLWAQRRIDGCTLVHFYFLLAPNFASHSGITATILLSDRT